jgi:hypothetical protein
LGVIDFQTSAAPLRLDLRAMKKTSSSIKRITLCLATAAAALGLNGCDSKRENAAEKKADQMENKADNVRDAGEKKADAIESKKSMSNDHATNERLENKADATRNAAEHKADAIEKEADAVRDQSPSPSP